MIPDTNEVPEVVEVAKPIDDGKTIAPPAVPAVPAAKEVEAIVKKWKLKFGDTEEEVDETELVKRAQKAWGIEKKAEKASVDRKMAEDFFQLAKKGDFSWLDKVGVEGKKVVSEWLVQQAIAEDEEARLSPDQKELREARKKLADISSQEQAREKEKRDITIKEQAEKFTLEMQIDYKAAAEENGLVAENEVVQALTAQYLEKAVKEGIVITPREVMPIVKKHIEALDEARFNSYDGEKLVSWLGKHIEKVRKADLATLKGGVKKAPDSKAGVKPEGAKEDDKAVPSSFKQMIKQNRAKWDEA